MRLHALLAAILALALAAGADAQSAYPGQNPANRSYAPPPLVFTPPVFQLWGAGQPIYLTDQDLYQLNGVTPVRPYSMRNRYDYRWRYEPRMNPAMWPQQQWQWQER
jgi:hypothetical protein